jgi:hypothetical protein
MSTITILRILESQNPKLVQKVRDLIVAPEPSEDVVRKIYAHCFLIHKSGDEFRDYVIFVSSILQLYSPETLIADCKVRNGVCSVMAERLGVSQQMVSYYVKHARHYYSNLIAVREAVDRIVERFGGRG